MTTTTGSDTVQHAIGPTGELSLRIPTGEVHLRAVDGDTARVRDLDGRDLEERLVVEATDGRLSIRPRDRFLLDFGWAIGGFGRGLRLDVEVPANAQLSVDTASAEIDSRGTHGSQHYRTASGGIELLDVAGDIQIDSVSGDTSVRLAGESKITGRAVSGDVKIRDGIVRLLRYGTTSGDIEVSSTLAGEGPFAVETVSGDVSVATNRGLSVTGRTVTGDIFADGARRADGRGQHFVSVGDGKTPFTFKSVSGDLRIARLADGTAAASAAPGEERRDSDAQARGDERLAILRELEAGSIDIEAASRRLAELDRDA
jgi:hypothetical protein